jgi:hypothetical protein
LLDKILHHNEISSNTTQSKALGGFRDENDQDRASIGCNYLLTIQ